MLYQDILSLSRTLDVSLLLTTDGPPLPSRPDNVGRLNCKNLFPSEYHYSHLSKLCNISQEFARKPFLIFAGKTLSLPVLVAPLHRSQGCLRLLLIWATTQESVETTLTEPLDHTLSLRRVRDTSSPSILAELEFNLLTETFNVTFIFIFWPIILSREPLGQLGTVLSS